MELKATLNDYTAPEFQALIDKILAVDLPKQDHDRLINHFDRIVGNPKGADLLFYPDDSFDSSVGSSWIMHHVRDWHHKQGMAAFRGEVFPVAKMPAVSLSPIARNISDLQKINTDVTASGQVLVIALSHFESAINLQRNKKLVHANVAELATNIRTLERARNDTHSAFRKYESWKVRVESFINGTQRNLSYAQSDQAQWQSQVQQIAAIHARYLAQSASTTQRFRALYDEAEALLVGAHEELIRSRNMAGVGPAQAACTVTASLAYADKLPDILLGDRPSTLFLSQQKDLQKSIRSAVGEFTWRNTAGESVDGHECAAVLQFLFTSRADTEVYGLSVPLAELVVLEGQDWQRLARNRAEVAVPLRMLSAIAAAKPGTMFQGMREVKTLSRVYVTPFQGSDPAPKVRVRAARQGEKPSTFSFTADGTAPITVSWSDPVALESDSSTVGTPFNRLGFIHSLQVPPLEPLNDKENLRFDDYIVVFPEESGMDPLYVMFRDRREYPT